MRLFWLEEGHAHQEVTNLKKSEPFCKRNGFLKLKTEYLKFFFFYPSK